VIWSSDNSNNDDSVYKILGVNDINTLVLDVSTAGSTRLGGKTCFTSRTNVNYRIVDIATVATTPSGNTNWLVCNLSGAPNVNPGQSVSQFMLMVTSSNQQVVLQVSPSGTWNGSSFSDASSMIGKYWFNASDATGVGRFTVLGGRDFLIYTHKGVDSAWGALNTPPVQPVLHVEVPKRLYPQQCDPNPVAWMMTSNSAGIDGISQLTGSYASGLQMVCDDGVTRNWVTKLRTITASGDQVSYSITPVSGGLFAGFEHNKQYQNVNFNAFSASYISTDAVLMQTGSASDHRYTPTRAKLRRVRFTTPNCPPDVRLGENWVHIGGGIMWPWDGSERPFGLFPNGGGAGGFEPG
jgi:hypothetical protein